MPSLPDLKYRELINLLSFFCAEVQGENSPQLKARTGTGRIAIIHCHPSKGLWGEALSGVLKDLDVSREDFWAWYHGGRRRS
ncbi:MAG: hypothetical protein M3024_14355 [Candidatus Dormibacteraeota bacterium]|nr:hypothetical protein [Candidatus Dormibacteraeota bacterium]